MALGVYDRFREMLERGVSAATIEEQDLGELMRARDAVASDDAAGVDRVCAAMLERLESVR